MRATTAASDPRSIESSHHLYQTLALIHFAVFDGLVAYYHERTGSMGASCRPRPYGRSSSQLPRPPLLFLTRPHRCECPDRPPKQAATVDREERENHVAYQALDRLSQSPLVKQAICSVRMSPISSQQMPLRVWCQLKPHFS